MYPKKVGIFVMKKTIDLSTAIFICLNIMLGGGIFINLHQLTFNVGSFGFIIYLLVFPLLFPVIYCLASLGSAHCVSGGLYVYSKKCFI